MKLSLIIVPVFVAVVAGFIAVGDVSEARLVHITMNAKSTITAGDPWDLSVQVGEGGAGDTVRVRLFNGLQTFDEQLVLDGDGKSVWRIPPGQITQAGTSLAVASYGNVSERMQLRVEAEHAVDVDLFTTANIFPAYGEGHGTLLILPRDRWGNPPADSNKFAVHVSFPGDLSASYPFEYRGGLGWVSFVSRGAPGRVRVTLAQDHMIETLELLQTPGPPAQITVSLSPDCVLDDGRDMISLSAYVFDAHSYPVADGTLVVFTWRGGLGYGRTIDGQATLNLPAPPKAGRYSYAAKAGTAESEAIHLRVSGQTCADE